MPWRYQAAQAPLSPGLAGIEASAEAKNLFWDLFWQSGNLSGSATQASGPEAFKQQVRAAAPC